MQTDVDIATTLMIDALLISLFFACVLVGFVALCHKNGFYPTELGQKVLTLTAYFAQGNVALFQEPIIQINLRANGFFYVIALPVNIG